MCKEFVLLLTYSERNSRILMAYFHSWVIAEEDAMDRVHHSTAIQFFAKT